MRLINNRPHYSPTDLVRYLGSPYASWYDRLVLQEPEHLQCKDPEDAMSQTLARRGYAHEEGVTEAFKADGKAVAKPASKSKQKQLSETIELMRNGVDVIEQAVLSLDNITGYADFLVRVPGASDLGDWHYEVWDAKLARSVKPSFVIQLCCYTEMVDAIQERLPEAVRVALGSNETESVPLNTCYAFYLRLKQQFMQAQQAWSPATPPDPAHFRHHGHWSEQAMSVLAERDHLCFTATITRTQIKNFHVAGIETVQQLSETPLEHVAGISPVLFDRLKVQARLQRSSADKERPDYQLVAPDKELATGLHLLPPHSSQDVFFDIEGFPLIEGGLEYLWGCTYFTEDGERTFLDFWAHEAGAEKRAFEGFIDWVYARWMADSSMHIYHYASYEVSACRRLMGRFGTREHELDQLLRNEVFFDLYRIVRQGLIVGEPRYSIKNIELLYRGKRETEVSGGGESIVVYENWREAFAAGEEGDCWRTSDTLKQIRDYNIDDCDSTQELVDWLRARQLEANISYAGAGADDVLVTELNAEQLAVQLLRDRLMKKSEALFDTDPGKAALWQTLGGVLEFHWREAKPGFWRLFDRLGADPAELADDPDCLAHCVRTDTPPFKERPGSRNLTYEYRFDADQEFRGVGKLFQLVGYETQEGKSLKVELIHESSDLENGLVALKCRQEPPDILSLVLSDFINPAPIPQAIAAVVTNIEAGSGNHAAILSLLQREKPGFEKSFSQQLTERNGAIAPNEHPAEKLQQIIDAVSSLQQSCLVIQGPPGTGKTFTASRVIGQLMKNGCKVGVSSNSHAAINNLLLATAKYCSEAGVDAAITCTKYTTDEMQDAGVMQCTNAALVNKVQPGSLVGTTAWGFSRDDMANTLDYLFVDEAGQVALANVIGMSRSADNLVLLGDQMQLGQPTQGTHPGKSGSSVLEYMMGEQATIAEDEGVFLGTGFRMHSAVNQFISKQFYDNRLQSRPENDDRCLLLSASLQSELSAAGAGVFFMPVTHAGNTQGSVEEAHRIAELVNGLLCSELRVDGGSQRPLVLNDMLFVAPYNQQVRILREILGPDARVGSVDKFQGQEAPVVFLSLCASDASESPRGLGFLLDRHRINVAVSRAQSLVIVVGHPQLISGPVDTMAALEQANLFAALVA